MVDRSGDGHALPLTFRVNRKFSELEGGSFLPQECIGGRGWGHMAIQAARGSVAVFRMGWYFDERSSDPRHTVNAAASERDRILQAIQRWL
jgi:hypothetical protein